MKKNQCKFVQEFTFTKKTLVLFYPEGGKINLQYKRETFSIDVKYSLKSILTKTCFSLSKKEDLNIWAVEVKRVREQCRGDILGQVCCTLHLHVLLGLILTGYDYRKDQKKIDELWAHEGVQGGWICKWRYFAQWNLSSVTCQGSSSPSRAQKHVQTSSACRQRDVNCFPQILLNLPACRSIKIAKLCTLPLGSNPPPAKRNSCFNFCLCHRFALEPNYHLSLMTT